MTSPPGPLGRAAVSLAAAVLGTLLLAGCSQEDSAAGGTPSSPADDRGTSSDPEPGMEGKEGKLSSSPDSGGSDSGGTGEEEPPKEVSAGPKIPREEITPATGSFTKKQKNYLTGRVPKGIDPAAILVGGEETCQRIARTAKADRAAAVDAIRSGEIADAKAVITHLCPEHGKLLKEAGS